MTSEEFDELIQNLLPSPTRLWPVDTLWLAIEQGNRDADLVVTERANAEMYRNRAERAERIVSAVTELLRWMPASMPGTMHHSAVEKVYAAIQREEAR